MARFLRELTEAITPASVGALGRAGVTPDMLRGPRWTRAARGFYRPADAGVSTPTQRILDVAALLPAGAVIGGWAAAYALGVDWLDGLDHLTLEPLPVTVVLPPRMRRRSLPGVQVRPAEPRLGQGGDHRRHSFHRRAENGSGSRPVGAGPYRSRGGAGRLPGLPGALARKAHSRRDRIAWPAWRTTGPSGDRAEQVSSVRSPWESRLRMLYVLGLRLPSPSVNQPVFDQLENFLGAPDLLDEKAGLALEYDGARWSLQSDHGHRDREQHREDNAREEGLERVGLLVVRAEKADLTRFRPSLERRITAARADGLSRDRRRDRGRPSRRPTGTGCPPERAGGCRASTRLFGPRTSLWSADYRGGMRVRYGPWHGGPDPLKPPFDVRAALDQIGQEVLSAGSLRDALRDLRQRGARRPRWSGPAGGAAPQAAGRSPAPGGSGRHSRPDPCRVGPGPGRRTGGAGRRGRRRCPAGRDGARHPARRRRRGGPRARRTTSGARPRLRRRTSRSNRCCSVRCWTPSSPG